MSISLLTGRTRPRLEASNKCSKLRPCNKCSTTSAPSCLSARLASKSSKYSVCFGLNVVSSCLSRKKPQTLSILSFSVAVKVLLIHSSNTCSAVSTSAIPAAAAHFSASTTLAAIANALKCDRPPPSGVPFSISARVDL